MERATTPTPTAGPSDPAPPRTPNASANATPRSAMRARRNTPAPSTPGGNRRVSSVPHTPSSSALVCSSSPSTFARVTVHTAKCSECDVRNKGTMLRCPGCTFQICKPCQDRREKAGKILEHGNMLSPQVATPGTGGSVVRRKPVAAVKSVERKGEKEKVKEGNANEEKKEAGESTGKKRQMKPAPTLRLKSKPGLGEATLSEDAADHSSDEDFAPDPASPTMSKRRRTEVTSKTDDASELPSPFLKSSDKVGDSTTSGPGGSGLPEKHFCEMSTDELLAYHGVNTPSNPYQAHLLSRSEPVVSNPVIRIPEVVKRGFKPLPTAEEIQKNIQDKVREKLGLQETDPDGSA